MEAAKIPLCILPETDIDIFIMLFLPSLALLYINYHLDRKDKLPADGHIDYEDLSLYLRL